MDSPTDLTKGEPTLKNSTIEELKTKLEAREIVDESDTGESIMIPETVRPTAHHQPPPLINDEGLIVPRKPPNPVRENPVRQNLHRELLFNQKMGKNVLNQKSELQRALDRHKDNVAKKNMESHIAAQTPELEKVIADRAKRIQGPVVDNKDEDDKVINKEFLEARMKLKATHELK